MKKILFVATVVKTHIMEFHVPYLKMMKEEGWETSVAARNDYENKSDCNIPYCDFYYDIDFTRFPFHYKNLKAYKQLKEQIDKNDYDVIHCHTPVGGVLARLASIRSRKKGTKVIYTAHGFHFYKGAPLLNWLLFFPIEWVCSFFTDVLITINSEDYKLAKKWLHANRIEYIPGVGVDVEKFSKAKIPRDKMRESLGINQDDLVLLSVAELTKNKNHKLVFDALSRIKNESDLYDRIKYVVCGDGAEYDNLVALSKEFGIEDHVLFLGYRNDVPDINNCADIFVFVSKREGLSLALMEAMACGKMIIASSIRGNVDLIGKDCGILIDNDVDELVSAIYLLSNTNIPFGKNAKDAVLKYSIDRVLPQVRNLYE